MLRSSLVFLLACSACGSERLVPTKQLDQTNEPDVPVEEPEPCMFYGIDSMGILWLIDPVELSVEKVGDTGVPGLTDVAIMPDGRMFAFDEIDFYAISPTTAEVTLLASDAFDANFGLVGADALPDGRLLAGGYGAHGFIDVDSPQYGKKPSVLSGGYQFSGDFAAIDARRAYATIKRSGANDKLILLDVDNGTFEDLGSLGVPRVYGLDFGCDGELYGLVSSDPPVVLHLLPTDDGVEVTELGALEGPHSLWGAAGPTK